MAKQLIPHDSIYVAKNNLVFFMPDLAELATLSMSSDVFFDLEIISEPGLERVLKNWLQQSRLKPNSTAVFIDEANYYYTDLAKTPAAVSAEEIQEFANTVPFNDVISKVFPTQRGSRIIVLNRNFLYPLVTVLERCGFNILLVAPAFAAGITSETPFTKELAFNSLKNQNLYSQYNFIEVAQLAEKIAREKSFFSVEVNKQLIAMVLILFGLVAVLISLLLFQQVSAWHQSFFSLTL